MNSIYSMGQLISWLTGGLEKKDVNLNYETYGREGEADYAVDYNGEYQPSDYDYMEEPRGVNRIQSEVLVFIFKLLVTLYVMLQPKTKAEKSGKHCVCLTILFITMITLGLVGMVLGRFQNQFLSF